MVIPFLCIWTPRAKVVCVFLHSLAKACFKNAPIVVKFHGPSMPTLNRKPHATQKDVCMLPVKSSVLFASKW